MANIEDDAVNDEDEEDWSAPVMGGPEDTDRGYARSTVTYTSTSRGTRDPSTQEPALAYGITTPTTSTKEGLMSRMQLNDNKAGMEGLDRERINKIIYEASKGSRFYENEMKKEKQMAARVEEMQKRLALLSPEQIQAGIQEADLILQMLEAGRDLTRTIVHVDMDMFYAAVEMKDNPALRDVPMAVGSSSMLSTSNYIARRFGVRAAMPGFIGRKLCPDLVIVPTNFEKYTAVSKQIRAVMADYDPHFSPMSLDEAFLDMTSHIEKRAAFNVDERTFQTMLTPEELCVCDTKAHPSAHSRLCDVDIGRHGQVGDNAVEDIESTKMADTHTVCSICGKRLCASQGKVETFGLSAEEAVREMRARIHWETKLTASAGIAPNTMLAKVCSDQNKPNGQYSMPPSRDAVLEFVKKLDIRKVSGIGKVATQLLRSLGVNTCADLFTRRGVLYHLYSEVSFNYFLRISVGIGSTTVERDGVRKSMSVERTFSEIRDPKDLYQKCHDLSVSLAEDLNDEQIVGKTVGIKLKTVNFQLMTRAQTLLNPTCDANQIYGAARELLRTEILHCQPEPLRLRLMGVRMSNLMAKNAVRDQKQCTITSLLSKMKSKPPTQESTAVPSPPVKYLSSSSTDPEESTNHSANIADEKSKSEGVLLRSHSGKVAKTSKTFLCPICSKGIAVPNLEQFNRHVDKCLARCPAEVQEEHLVCLSVTQKKETANTISESDQIEQRPPDVEPVSCSLSLKKICLMADGEEQPETEDESHDGAEILRHAEHEEQEMGSQTSNSTVGAELLDTVDRYSKTVSPPEGLQGVLEEHCKQADSVDVIQTLAGEMPSQGSVVKEGVNVLICPICNKRQDTFDLRVFNKHVDECLSQGLLVSGDPCLTLASKVSVAGKRFVKPTGLTKKKSTTASRAKSSVLQEAEVTRPEAMTSLPSTCSAPGESEENLVLACPVCDLSQEWMSLNAFSRHVDSCLNRAAIRDMLNDDTSTQTKRPRPSPPDEPASKRKKSLAKGIQRIDSFFKH